MRIRRADVLAGGFCFADTCIFFFRNVDDESMIVADVYYSHGYGYGYDKGYMFPDAPSIAPYLEHPRTGPTSAFCAELARHLQCYVVAGFPERLAPFSTQSFAPSDLFSLSSTSTSLTTVATTSIASPSPPPSPDPSPPLSSIGANAALIYDTTGHLLHTYHKSNLFPTDITWARPGPGFTTLDLPMPFGRIAVAICNDLNVNVNGPDEGVWRSIERGPYELAGYCRREGVRVLVLLNAWLQSEEEKESTDGNGQLEEDNDTDFEEMEDDGEGGDDGLEPNWRVVNYWAMRLRPLWASDVDESMDTAPSVRRSETSAEMARTNDERELLVVICNRFGHERGAISYYPIHFSGRRVFRTEAEPRVHSSFKKKLISF